MNFFKLIKFKSVLIRFRPRSIYNLFLLLQIIISFYVLENSLLLSRYQYSLLLMLCVVSLLPVLQSIIQKIQLGRFITQQHTISINNERTSTSYGISNHINYAIPFLPLICWYKSAKKHFSHLNSSSCYAVIAALIAFSLALFLLPHSEARLTTFLPEQVSLYAIVDSYPQRLAYQCYILALLAAVFVIQILRRYSYPIARTENYMPVIMSVLLLIAIILSLWSYPLGDRERYLLVFTCLVALMAYHTNLRWVAWCYIVCVIAFAIMPGWLHLPAPLADGLKGCDQHYDMVMYRGRHLASGHLFSQDSPPYYSLLWSTLIGAFSKLLRVPTFAELVRFTQLGQVLFLLAYAMAAWLRTRSLSTSARAVALTFATIAVIPWLTTDSITIWRPNQTGLRYLFIPIAISTMWLIQHLPLRQASILVGIITGLSLLANFETGIVVMAGLGMSWLLLCRQRPLLEKLYGALLGVIAVTLVFITWALIYLMVFHASPLPDGIYNLFSFLSLFAGGFGGLGLPLRVIVVCMMCHAGYIFIRAITGIVNTQSVIPDIVTCGIAVMMLVWFPYYINRPDDWNLWTFIALYSLLLAPSFSGNRADMVPFMICLCIVLPISARFFPSYVLDQYVASGINAGVKVGCAGGLVLPTDYCAHLAHRAQTLKDFARRGTLVWSTALPVLTDQMTSLRGPFWTSNLLSLSITTQEYHAILNKIKKGHFDYLILDDPHDPFIQPRPPENAFHQRLLHDLQTEYCEPRLIGGWTIAQRKREGGCRY